jgi:hypothetical protein
MCKCVLPPGFNPIAVDKYININIKIKENLAERGTLGAWEMRTAYRVLVDKSEEKRRIVQE